MARALEETRQLERDKKRIKGSGRFDWVKMRAVVNERMNDRPLDLKHHDHELSGEYAGVRECLSVRTGCSFATRKVRSRVAR